MNEEWNLALSEDVIIYVQFRRTARSDSHPAGIKFAVIGTVREKEDFEEKIRIDNYTHQGKSGTHIHFLDKEPRKGQEAVEYAENIVRPEHAVEYVQEYLTAKYPHRC